MKKITLLVVLVLVLSLFATPLLGSASAMDDPDCCKDLPVGHICVPPQCMDDPRDYRDCIQMCVDHIVAGAQARA